VSLATTFAAKNEPLPTSAAASYTGRPPGPQSPVPARPEHRVRQRSELERNARVLNDQRDVVRLILANRNDRRLYHRM
jgi:hypothetical protein